MSQVYDPTLKVEVAFTTAPFETPAWVDITAYVEKVSIRRGKARVLEGQQAGSCTVVLDNSDQRFTPKNTQSPYYPNVKPMRRLRVTAVADGTWDSGSWDDGVWDGGSEYGLFSGFVESWPLAYRGSLAVTSVTAIDGFKALNLPRVTASYPQQLSSARVTAILDDVGWPAADRDIDTGQTTVQAVTLEAENPLAHLLKVADTENGLLFMDRDGKVRFRSRHGLIGGVLDSATFTFGDQAGDQLYESVVPQFDDRDIWNEVEVSSQGVTTQTASDAASIAEYGPRTLSKTGMLMVSETEQANYAKFLVASYKDAEVSLEQVRFEVVGFWARILSAELGTKVLVESTPEGSDTISQPSYIEGITFDIDVNGWRCSWDLVALTRRAYFWVLGDSVQGVLGQSSVLAY